MVELRRSSCGIENSKSITSTAVSAPLYIYPLHRQIYLESFGYHERTNQGYPIPGKGLRNHQVKLRDRQKKLLIVMYDSSWTFGVAFSLLARRNHDFVACGCMSVESLVRLQAKCRTLTTPLPHAVKFPQGRSRPMEMLQRPLTPARGRSGELSGYVFCDES